MYDDGGMKPYWNNNLVTIYHGLAEEVFPHISISEKTVVVTDPPYGISHPTNYKQRGRSNIAECTDYPPVYGDNTPFDPSLILQYGKRHVIFGANYFCDRLPISSGWLVWDKERPDMLDQSTCELIWTDCIKGVRRFRHLWHGALRASEKGKGKLFHPTQKPVALIEWILRLKWLQDVDLVIDPYMGSGSTLIAAQNLGIQSIGIEQSLAYCDVASLRAAEGSRGI